MRLGLFLPLLLTLAEPVSSPDKLVTAVIAPAAAATEVSTKTLSGTIGPLFMDPNKAGFGEPGLTQNVTFESDSANTARICIAAIAIPRPVVIATDTCTEVCATASAVTCNKTSTDGEWIDPGQTLPHRDTGAFCYCGLAATGSPIIQSRRVMR